MAMNSLFACGVVVLTCWQYIQGEDYILAMPGSSFIRAVSGDTPGWIEIDSKTRYSIEDYSEISVAVKKSVTTSNSASVIKENKSVLVSTSDSSLNIYGQSDTIYFSPLPISALGTKYIVMTCYRSNIKSALVIASHSQKTSVVIQFRVNGIIRFEGRTFTNGDTLNMTLQEYQTLTIISDLDITGTLITSGYSVAVFSGALGASLSAYDQLIPVEQYKQEYGFAVSSIIGCGNAAGSMHMQIISEHYDTNVTFNNERTFSLGNNFYEELLQHEDSIYLNTSRPVMTTLCRRDTHVRGFLVVPPLSAGVKQSNLAIGRYNTGSVKILTTGDTSNIQVTSSLSSSLKIEWKQLGKSRYHVGLLTLPRPTYIIFSSNSSVFIVLVYHVDYIYSTGYNFDMEFPESTSADYQTAPNGETSSDSTYTYDASAYQTTPSLTTATENTAQVCREPTDNQCTVTQTVVVACGCVIAILLIIITVLTVYTRKHIRQCVIEPPRVSTDGGNYEFQDNAFETYLSRYERLENNSNNLNTNRHDYGEKSGNDVIIEGVNPSSEDMKNNVSSELHNYDYVSENMAVVKFDSPHDGHDTEDNTGNIDTDPNSYYESVSGSVAVVERVGSHKEHNTANRKSSTETEPHNYEDVEDSNAVLKTVNPYIETETESNKDKYDGDPDSYRSVSHNVRTSDIDAYEDLS